MSVERLGYHPLLGTLNKKLPEEFYSERGEARTLNKRLKSTKNRFHAIPTKSLLFYPNPLFDSPEKTRLKYYLFSVNGSCKAVNAYTISIPDSIPFTTRLKKNLITKNKQEISQGPNSGSSPLAHGAPCGRGTCSIRSICSMQYALNRGHICLIDRTRLSQPIHPGDWEIHQLHTVEKKTIQELLRKYDLSEVRVWGICTALRKQAITKPLKHAKQIDAQ
ncbi:MAG: hypothetical protein ABSG01_14895 [Anaerolineales bacterium]